MVWGYTVKGVLSIYWDHPPCRSWDISHAGILPWSIVPARGIAYLWWYLQLGLSKGKALLSLMDGLASQLVQLYLNPWKSIILSFVALRVTPRVFLGISRSISTSSYDWGASPTAVFLGYITLSLICLWFILYVTAHWGSCLFRQVKELRAFGGILGGVTVSGQEWVTVSHSPSFSSEDK